MLFYLETERLILRDLLPEDDIGMFRLDSDPRVHTYLGNHPLQHIEQAQGVIAMVRQQYLDFGIGRWAVIEKASGDFIGWSGLKWIDTEIYGRNHFYDVGYRLIPQYWGKGYATESCRAALAYGFSELPMQEVIGIAHVDNHASRRALEKSGFTQSHAFYFERWAVHCHWFSLLKSDWEQQQKNILRTRQ